MTEKLVYKKLVLNDAEQLLKIVRQSRWYLILKLIPGVLMAILSFFIMFPLFYWSQRGIFIFGALLLIGIFLIIKVITTWYLTTLILTNQRIVDVDQKKLFSQIVSDIPLNKIQDVFYQIHGLFQAATRTGDLKMVLTDEKTKIEVKNIFRPRKIQQLILESKSDQLVESFNATKLSAAELVSLVEKIKKGIGEEKFKRIVEEDKNDRAKIG